MKFENVQKAIRIIRDSSADIHKIFTQEAIISEKQLGSALQQSKNILGWLKLLSGEAEE